MPQIFIKYYSACGLEQKEFFSIGPWRQNLSSQHATLLDEDVTALWNIVVTMASKTKDLKEHLIHLL